MQQFEDGLIAEELAQTSYYNARPQLLLMGSSRPFIEPKLQKPQGQRGQSQPQGQGQPPPRLALDNLSVRSAPTLTRSTSGSHLCTASPPSNRPRVRKWPRGHHHYREAVNSRDSNLGRGRADIKVWP